MKIRVFLCSEDALYCEKIVNYFNSYYYDKFQWNVYTQPVYLEQIFRSDEPDLILVGSEMQTSLGRLDPKLLEGKIWAYLTEDDAGLKEGKSCISKYRRADQIYRELLDLYAKSEHVRHEAPLVSGKTAFIAFVSAGGGPGTSTIACAAAKSFSAMDKVLYINLEDIGLCGGVFTGENTSGFDEIVYAIKSRRNTLGLKLESAVSRDRSGTYYFRECTNPMDLQTLSAEDIRELLRAIEASGVYDKVIIDLGNGLHDKEITVMSMVASIIVIMDPGEIAELKLKRYLEYMQAVEEVKQMDIISKMSVYYNKTMKSRQLPEQVQGIRTGGAFPLIENGTYAGIIDKIAAMELLQTIK